MAVLARLALCLTLALAGAAQAQEAREQGALARAAAGSVRIFVSGSMSTPLAAVRGPIEKATGRKLVMEVSESRNLQREIEAGQPFEAALMTTAVIDDLAAKGRIAPGSAQAIGMVRVGVSVRGTPPKLDVTTPQGLKAAILGAHSIRRFYGVAASTPVLDNLFTKLDLTAATRDRMVALGGDLVVPEAPLAPGQYELIINLISAILPMPGWTYVGAIPEDFQMPIAHAAGLGATGDQAVGRKVLEVLKGPEFAAALAANKITPR